jgi:hypothetical protein
MTGRYKPRNCPICEKEFRARKEQQTCSRACGEKLILSKGGRKMSDEHKKIMSEYQKNLWKDKNSEYNQQRMLQLKDNVMKVNGYETDPIPPMQDFGFSVDIDEHHEIVGGDYWTQDGF